MRQWEYMLESIDTTATPNDVIVARLNRLGRMEWEVVAVNWPNSGIILLRRRKD